MGAEGIAGGICRRLVAERASIERRVHVHGLRHSFAVESIRRGAKINVLSKVLGHANSGITWRYVFQLSPIMGRHTHVGVCSATRAYAATRPGG